MLPALQSWMKPGRTRSQGGNQAWQGCYGGSCRQTRRRSARAPGAPSLEACSPNPSSGQAARGSGRAPARLRSRCSCGSSQGPSSARTAARDQRASQAARTGRGRHSPAAKPPPPAPPGWEGPVEAGLELPGAASTGTCLCSPAVSPPHSGQRVGSAAPLTQHHVRTRHRPARPSARLRAQDPQSRANHSAW